MQRHTGSRRALEKYRIFPYIAWTLIIVFTLFVYRLTVTLQNVTNQLERQTQALEAQIASEEVDSDLYDSNRFGRNTAE